MASKTRKLDRLHAVLHALETVERANVGELTQRIDNVRRAQDDILQSLAEPTPLHGRFIGLLSRRIGALERELHTLSRQREVALARYGDAKARERVAKSLFDRSTTIEARAAEDRNLESLLEFFDAAAAQGRDKSTRST